ncbi:MAG: putative porin [Candidatus Omnitrophica bacterium]|nr:putative porin [Candidatus Omnitrophota bacterium]
MTRRCLALLVLIGFVVAGAGIGPAYAGEMDILLQKLVEKGVLTAGEAQEIKVETQEQVKKEISQGKSESSPKWAQNVKVKGDIRYRYQAEKRKGTNTDTDTGLTNSRERHRVRARLGVDAKVNQQLNGHFGIASGSDTDPRSTNQTLQDSFAKKPLWIDYAYVDYTPANWATLYGGRMKNVLWEPGDMMWDTDINPEGGAVKLEYKYDPTLSFYLTNCAYIMDEYATTSDPWLYAIQPGAKWDITDRWSLQTAFGYNIFSQMQDRIMDSTSSTNTRNAQSGLYYDFYVLNQNAEIMFKDPLKDTGISLPFGLDIPMVAGFGELAYNTESHDDGYLVGGKLGYDKVADWKQWQLKYQYVYLGTNAWPDFLPDSDRYSGRTGIRSHEAVLGIGLGKNWSLDLDYYRNALVHGSNTGTTDTNRQRIEHLFQANMNFKF